MARHLASPTRTRGRVGIGISVGLGNRGQRASDCITMNSQLGGQSFELLFSSMQCKADIGRATHCELFRDPCVRHRCSFDRKRASSTFRGSFLGSAPKLFFARPARQAPLSRVCQPAAHRRRDGVTSLAGGHLNVRSARCYRALYAALTKQEGCARMHGLTPTATPFVASATQTCNQMHADPNPPDIMIYPLWVEKFFGALVA
jgi:hypothetical protein